MSGEFELFKKVAREEISSLEKKGSWVVMKRSSVKINILPSAWALKRKRHPDGRIRKYKALFCVRGDWQRYGLDYGETYAPAVQWSTDFWLEAYADADFAGLWGIEDLQDPTRVKHAADT